MREPRLDEDEGAPEWWRRAKGLRAAPLLLVVVLVAIIVHASQGTPPPALRTSCTTPAVALSDRSVKQHHPVQWSATGPAGMRFLLALGVDHIRVEANGTFTAVPVPGLVRGEQASHELVMPKGCKTNDVFGVTVPPGSYTLKMFRLSRPGAAASATEAASAPLKVTPASN